MAFTTVGLAIGAGVFTIVTTIGGYFAAKAYSTSTSTNQGEVVNTIKVEIPNDPTNEHIVLLLYVIIIIAVIFMASKVIKGCRCKKSLPEIITISELENPTMRV